MKNNGQSTKILSIDDDPVSLHLIDKILGKEYEVYSFLNLKTATDFLEKESPDIILADILMPCTNGFDFVRMMKKNPRIKDIPIILVSSLDDASNEKKGLDIGASDYISKPLHAGLLKSRVRTCLEEKKKTDDIRELLEIKKEEIDLVKDSFIDYMSLIAEYRDNETHAHLMRTELFCTCIAQTLSPLMPDRIHQDEVIFFAKSARLHDIGKIAVRDEILFKKGPLDEDEFAEMKKHTLVGSQIIRKTQSFLGKSRSLKAAAEIAELHHEKYDGSGYPYGLKGEDIPIASQVMLLCDVYDALVSRRSYKPAFSHSSAFNIITQGNKRTIPQHFSPIVLEIFKKKEKEMESIAKNYQD